MKFNVSSNILIEAITKVIGVTPTRSTLPILGNVLFRLEGNGLSLLGSDLEAYVEVKLEVDGKTNGQVAIPAKRLETLIQNLPDKELNVELQQNQRLIIKTKGGRWSITGEDPEDFPTPNEIENTQTISVNPEQLIRYLSKAIHAASQDELRRSMNGIYFEIKNGEFRVVATDGHRLVRIIKEGFEFSGNKTSMLVPVKTCNLLIKLFKSNDEESIDIFFSNQFLKCSSKNVTIISRLIDESFPNYESVIPQDNEKKLKVNRIDLVSAVKRSIIMSDQITNRTSMMVNNGEVKIKSANNEYGTDSEEVIPCSFTEDEEFEIAFNGKYLLDALMQFDSNDVIFDLNSPLKATILHPSEQEEAEDLMMLVMPVRNI